jgi:hypothetical protein
VAAEMISWNVSDGSRSMIVLCACRYVPSGSKEVRKIPLEIFVRGDNEPMYGVTTEDDGRGYAAARLPFQAYGTLGERRSRNGAVLMLYR